MSLMVTGRSACHTGSRLTRPSCSLPPTCTLTEGKALPRLPGVNETVEPGGDDDDERSRRSGAASAEGRHEVTQDLISDRTVQRAHRGQDLRDLGHPGGGADLQATCSADIA
jgi:hypothetical protein